MDPEQYEDILDDEQAYFDRMDETSKDLELSLAQDRLNRDLEESFLEHKATDRENKARRQQLEGGDPLERDIEHRRQKILDILRVSNPSPLLLPTFIKENWIKRLSSENWRSELERLSTEIAAYHVGLSLVKSLSTLEDKLKDLNFIVENRIPLIDLEDK